jgi:ribosomal protein L7Ae-like RNA K-turn-binding protein
VDLIGLANRARQAVAGYQKVRTWLASGRAGLLLQASDAAEGGRARLRGLGRGMCQELPVSQMLNAVELGGPFGRDACVHVAVAAGSFADRLVAELRRLESYGAELKERKVSAQR